MPHVYMALIEVAVCLAAGVASLRKSDKRVGPGFICLSIGTLGIALERVLPAAAPGLGDIGAGVLLLGSAFFMANLWHARQTRRSIRTD